MPRSTRTYCQSIRFVVPHGSYTVDIALPEGSLAEDYWEAVLKGAVNNNNKYSFNKSNLIEALKNNMKVTLSRD